MEVTLAVLCDAANESKQGKLNLTGIFHAVAVQQVPATHPFMVLAVSFQMEKLDIGKTRTIAIEILDPDQKQIGQRGEVKAPPLPAGGPVLPVSHFFFNFAGIPLSKVGPHHFNIYVDDKRVKTVPLEVVKVAPQVLPRRHNQA